MATDLLTRVEAKAGEALAAGEHYLGAHPMTVKGPVALSSMLEDCVATELPNHVVAHGPIDELRVADESIPNAFLAAVTESRLLIFGRSVTGKPKELTASYDIAGMNLDVIDHGDRARARTFVFSLESGEIFAGEAGINGKAEIAADRFVTAFHKALAANS